MSTRHYHVQAGMSGYLPESEAMTLPTKREALAALAREADDYRDAGYLVRGSARGGGYDYGWPDEPNSARVSIGGFFGRISMWPCDDDPCEIVTEQADVA